MSRASQQAIIAPPGSGGSTTGELATSPLDRSERPADRVAPSPASAAKRHEAGGARRSLIRRAVPYLRMARFRQWSKNVFVVLGAVLAYFYIPVGHGMETLGQLLLALVAVGLVASSNYVINELLDAPFDRLHPVKRNRPAAENAVGASTAVALWVALAMAGLAIALVVNGAVATWALVLWGMGIVYNVPPLRTKDVPYLDVLTESVNNPIRLLLGWHAIVPHLVPPVSLIACFWMVGAFLMSTKRFGEIRRIGDPAVAAAYRPVFRHYDDERLLTAMVFYAACAAFFAGIFIVRYKLELVLGIPMVAAFLAYYVRIGFRPDSPVQDPERLHRDRGIVFLATATVVTFLLLMFVEISGLYEIFNVRQAAFRPLWRLGG